MAVPQDLKYSETHEWYRVEGSVVTMGITQFAADELTDVTFVELPEVGSEVTGGESFGEIESVKATGELNCAVSGKVVEVNERLNDEPELVNNAPFSDGWMIKVEASDLSPLEGLLDAAAYAQSIEE